MIPLRDEGGLMIPSGSGRPEGSELSAISAGFGADGVISMSSDDDSAKVVLDL
jgi:hypothetical protein